MHVRREPLASRRFPGCLDGIGLGIGVGREAGGGGLDRNALTSVPVTVEYSNAAT